MQHRRAVSSVLLAVMALGCGEQIVAPAADVVVEVKYADGREDRVELSRAEINMARANMPRDLTAADTAGLIVTRTGENQFTVARYDKVLLTASSVGDRHTVQLASGDRYTVVGHVDSSSRINVGEHVTLQQAQSTVPCWVAALAFAAALAGIATCVTVVACGMAIAAFIYAEYELWEACDR